jgi:hypothetical protein
VPRESIARRLPFGLWKILAVGVVAALAGGIFYYAISLAHESAFNDERAFRVLGEVSTQFKSLEASRATILKSMPNRVKQTLPLCVPEGNSTYQLVTTPTDDAVKVQRDFELYLAQLDMADARLCRTPSPTAKAPPQEAAAKSAPVNRKSKAPADTVQDAATQSAKKESTAQPIPMHACSEVARGAVVFQVVGDRLTTTWCLADDFSYSLDEPFLRATRGFIGQDFFVEALLTLSDGTVLGEFARRGATSLNTRVALQVPVADTVNILNARGLIRATSDAVPDASDRAAAHTASETTRQPLAQDLPIENRSFRVYALPFSGSGDFIVAATSSSGKSAQLADGALYVVGLRPRDLPGSVNHALWPIGLGLITLLIPLFLLGWPLLRLMHSAAEESISRSTVIVSLAATIMIPALLTIGTAAVWDYFQLEAWAESNAAEYARSLEQSIRQDLVDGARILTSYTNVYDGLSYCKADDMIPIPPTGIQESWDVQAKFRPGAGLPMRPFLSFENDGTPLAATPVGAAPQSACSTVQLHASPEREPVLSWSPLRNILALDEAGRRVGPVFTVFQPVDVKHDLNLGSREYFQALKAGEAWSVSSGGSTVRMVAQRLFNRTDGSKTLQLAVSRSCTDVTYFCGIITGDMRMPGFLVAEPPPLMRFAVIDSQSGTVVFHSTDDRSLSENFFLESELEPALYAAVVARRSMAYAGRYIGDPHNFYYRPIDGTPWSVVVFFPEKELADLPLRAGYAALSGYMGTALGVLLLFAVGRWLWCRIITPQDTHPPWLHLLWPKMPLGRMYYDLGRWHPFLFAFIALVILDFRGTARTSAASVALAVLLLAALPRVLSRLLKSMPHRKLANSTEPRVKPEHAYAEALACTLFVGAIIPAYIFFALFGQLQLEGLLRDEFWRTTLQMDHRYDLIRADLRHWSPLSAEANPNTYPKTWSVVNSPELGISHAMHPQTVQGTGTPVGPMLSPYTKLIWESVAETAEQRRRAELLTVREHNDADCSLLMQGQIERCTGPLFDGTPATVWMKRPHRTLSIAADFDWGWPRFWIVLLAFGCVYWGTRLVCRYFTEGLLGLQASYMPRESVPSRSDCAVAYTDKAFRDLWHGLSMSEQRLLFQLASHQLVNPRNERVVQRLLTRKGLLRVDPYPMLSGPELEPLIRVAAVETHMDSVYSGAGKSPWRSAGPVAFIILMIVIAWLSWAAGGTMKALSAILLATVAFLGQVGQLLTIARSGFLNAPKSGG